MKVKTQKEYVNQILKNRMPVHVNNFIESLYYPDNEAALELPPIFKLLKSVVNRVICNFFSDKYKIQKYRNLILKQNEFNVNLTRGNKCRQLRLMKAETLLVILSVSIYSLVKHIRSSSSFSTPLKKSIPNRQSLKKPPKISKRGG